MIKRDIVKDVIGYRVVKEVMGDAGDSSVCNLELLDGNDLRLFTGDYLSLFSC